MCMNCLKFLLQNFRFGDMSSEDRQQIADRFYSFKEVFEEFTSLWFRNNLLNVSKYLEKMQF